MKLSALLLLSTLGHTDAFFRSHDIVTHDDGSVHLFEKTQHRRLTTNNLKDNSDAANTKFTVHGSQYVTQNLHVDQIATVGGLEFENNDGDLDVFGPKALDSLAGAGLSRSGTELAVDYGTTLGTALVGSTTTISGAQASAITANTDKVSMTLGTTSSTALAGDTTTISGAQASEITANTAKVSMALGTTSSTALAGDTTTISGAQASAITANTAKTGVTASQTSAIAANTAKPDPYRLEKMVLLLCNTLGIKFEHLERAVDGTFDPYERFSAIQVNDDDLYSTDSNSNLVDVTTATAAALCSTKTDVACPTGLSNKHALARCAAATCVASDYGLGGGCCAYD